MALTKEEKLLYKKAALELSQNPLLNKLIFVLDRECDKIAMRSRFDDDGLRREMWLRRATIASFNKLIQDSISIAEPPKEQEIQQLERID